MDPESFEKEESSQNAALQEGAEDVQSNQGSESTFSSTDH